MIHVLRENFEKNFFIRYSPNMWSVRVEWTDAAAICLGVSQFSWYNRSAGVKDGQIGSFTRPAHLKHIPRVYKCIERMCKECVGFVNFPSILKHYSNSGIRN